MNRPRARLLLPLLWVASLAAQPPSRPAAAPPFLQALALRGEGRDLDARTLLLQSLSQSPDEAGATLAFRLTQTLGDWEALQKAFSSLATPTASFRDRLLVLRLEAALSCADRELATTLTQELAFLQDFWFIGPFDNERGAGHKRAYPPEQSTTLDLRTPIEGKKRPVRWRRTPVPFAPGGRIDLDALVRPNDQVLCYAATVLHTTRRSPSCCGSAATRPSPSS